MINKYLPGGKYLPSWSTISHRNWGEYLFKYIPKQWDNTTEKHDFYLIYSCNDYHIFGRKSRARVGGYSEFV